MNKRVLLRAAPMVMLGFLAVGFVSLTALVLAARRSQ
jgi:hypothetical protein